MSLKTWKKQFYPVAACKVKEKDAVTHSLNKWLGLTRVNLAEHKVLQHGSLLRDSVDGSTFAITADSCALCYWYHDRLFAICSGCPLTFQREGAPCDIMNRDGEEDWAPYTAFTLYGDPEPMIKLLLAAKKAEERKKKRGRR